MNPNSSSSNPSYRHVTHRGAQAQTASDDRLAATMGRLNILHGQAGDFNENLNQEENVPGWREEEMTVRSNPGDLPPATPAGQPELSEAKWYSFFDLGKRKKGDAKGKD